MSNSVGTRAVFVGEGDAFAGAGDGELGELAFSARNPRANPLGGLRVVHAVLAAAREHRALPETGLPGVIRGLVDPGGSGDVGGELGVEEHPCQMVR
ncbi:hypothetical protein [Streptomyces sp. Y2F8-2]|uniref:hypothetical protein n=1 Tax=Streptomyces sp. Y2F8-2 TaxID=2759675 RepID=UPI0019082B21|nr:hypothetical protein [Streptomyces sp. Y2F8-2]